MDAVIIFFDHAFMHMDVFDMEAIATLKCVSKAIKTDIEFVCKSQEKQDKLWVEMSKKIKTNNSRQKKYIEDDKEVKKLFSNNLHIKQILRCHRYYDDAPKNKMHAVKLATYLKSLTFSQANLVFSGYENVTLKEQLSTINELLVFCSSKDIDMRIMSAYFVFYFINKLIKHNSKSFIQNHKQCILASALFRQTTISKSDELVKNIKDEVTSFPYSFIDKFIRLLQETRRLVIAV
jgi:hypothetical protein